jgi:phospholipid transport system transporter-binding protein
VNATAVVSAQSDTLTVSGVLDFDSVVALQATGRDWLAGAAPAACRLDLGGVQYSSSAGIALLLDWLRMAAALGKVLNVVQMPADMLALAKVSGLESFLFQA